MLYKLQKGSVPNYTSGQDPLVYLVSSAEAVAAAGSPFVFSDGNCASNLSQFAADLTQIESVVDWEVMNATLWANTADDPDRKRRRMAELLVHQRVPMSASAELWYAVTQ
jgi:ssDNA thymidine ADP-ribosyltransferase, DarT